MKYSSLNNMLLKIHEKWKTGELSQREVNHYASSLKIFNDNRDMNLYAITACFLCKVIPLEGRVKV